MSYLPRLKKINTSRCFFSYCHSAYRTYQAYMVERSCTPKNTKLTNRTMTNCNILNVFHNDHFKAILSTELCQLINIFESRGFSIRIVGGAVRDILIGSNRPKDIDLSTNATPDQMLKIFKAEGIHYIETGLQHGTLTAHINSYDFEVTTLRIDVETFGRKAKVEFTHDWKLDAERRDLTINAMSVDIQGNLYDYFNGVEDLNARRVRFVGNATQRIREDYLRILRYFRFYGRIALNPNEHDQETLNVIQQNCHGLKQVAVERIWVEMGGILCGNHAPSLMKNIYHLGVSNQIGLPSHSTSHLEHFSSVWSRSRFTQMQPVSLLTTFVDSPEEAEDLCRIWKLSNAERVLSKFIAANRQHHASPLEFCKEQLARHSSPHTLNALKINCYQLLSYLGLHKEEDELQHWAIPVFPVTGSDIKTHLDIKPGPILGKNLQHLKDLWVKSNYTLNKKDLLDKAKGA